MTSLRTFCVVAIAAVLCGCSALGLSSPKSFDQNLANAYGIHTAVVTATAQALQSGAISVADAKAVRNMEVDARTLLDTAKSAETAGDSAGAQKNLSLAMTALTALQSYVNARGSK